MVSIIIPVYNGQRTIRRCLNSVLKQTYPDIEIVVINDGSTDNSREITESMLSSAANKSITNKEKNEGLEMARRTGIAVSKGEFIFFLDADDYLEKEAIEKMVSAIRQSGADLVQCQSISFITLFKCIKLHIAGRNKAIDSWLIDKKENLKKEFMSFFGCGSFNVAAWAKMYKRELFDGLKTGHLFFGEDLYMNMQVFPKLNAVYMLSEPLYHYERQGLTSKYMPRFMDDVKRLYHLKIAMARDMGLEGAVLYSTIELRNCFKTHIESMILHKADTETGIKQWIEHELQDKTYDAFDWLRQQGQAGKAEISQAIMDRDAHRIYSLCRKSVYEWNWKKIARRILVHLN